MDQGEQRFLKSASPDHSPRLNRFEAAEKLRNQHNKSVGTDDGPGSNDGSYKESSKKYRNLINKTKLNSGQIWLKQDSIKKVPRSIKQDSNLDDQKSDRDQIETGSRNVASNAVNASRSFSAGNKNQEPKQYSQDSQQHASVKTGQFPRQQTIQRSSTIDRAALDKLEDDKQSPRQELIPNHSIKDIKNQQQQEKEELLSERLLYDTKRKSGNTLSNSKRSKTSIQQPQMDTIDHGTRDDAQLFLNSRTSFRKDSISATSKEKEAVVHIKSLTSLESGQKAQLVSEPKLSIKVEGDVLKVDVITTYKVVEDKAIGGDDEINLKSAPPELVAPTTKETSMAPAHLTIEEDQQQSKDDNDLALNQMKKNNTQTLDQEGIMSMSSVVASSIMTGGVTDKVVHRNTYQDIGGHNTAGFNGQYNYEGQNIQPQKIVTAHTAKDDPYKFFSATTLAKQDQQKKVTSNDLKIQERNSSQLGNHLGSNSSKTDIVNNVYDDKDLQKVQPIKIAQNDNDGQQAYNSDDNDDDIVLVDPEQLEEHPKNIRLNQTQPESLVLSELQKQASSVNNTCETQSLAFQPNFVQENSPEHMGSSLTGRTFGGGDDPNLKSQSLNSLNKSFNRIPKISPSLMNIQADNTENAKATIQTEAQKFSPAIRRDQNSDKVSQGIQVSNQFNVSEGVQVSERLGMDIHTDGSDHVVEPKEIPDQIVVSHAEADLKTIDEHTKELSQEQENQVKQTVLMLGEDNKQEFTPLRNTDISNKDLKTTEESALPKQSTIDQIEEGQVSTIQDIIPNESETNLNMEISKAVVQVDKFSANSVQQTLSIYKKSDHGRKDRNPLKPSGRLVNIQANIYNQEDSELQAATKRFAQSIDAGAIQKSSPVIVTGREIENKTQIEHMKQNSLSENSQLNILTSGGNILQNSEQHPLSEPATEMMINDYQNRNMPLAEIRGSFDQRFARKHFDLTKHHMAAAGKLTLPDKDGLQKYRGSYQLQPLAQSYVGPPDSNRYGIAFRHNQKNQIEQLQKMYHQRQDSIRKRQFGKYTTSDHLRTSNQWQNDAIPKQTLLNYKLSQSFDLTSFVEQNNLQHLVRTSATYQPGNFRFRSQNPDMTERSVRKAQFEEGLHSGMFDIENAFELVQIILYNSRRKSIMNDEAILHYLDAKGMLLKGDDFQAQIKQYKWREVMKFMQGNPHILVQLLSFNDSPRLSDRRDPLPTQDSILAASTSTSPRQRQNRSLHDDYYNSAQQQHSRYTYKVIDSIVKNMPKAKKSQEAILKKDILNKMLGKSKDKKKHKQELPTLSMDEHLKRKEKIYDRRQKMGLKDRSPEAMTGAYKRNRFTKSPRIGYNQLSHKQSKNTVDRSMQLPKTFKTSKSPNTSQDYRKEKLFSQQPHKNNVKLEQIQKVSTVPSAANPSQQAFGVGKASGLAQRSKEDRDIFTHAQQVVAEAKKPKTNEQPQRRPANRLIPPIINTQSLASNTIGPQSQIKMGSFYQSNEELPAHARMATNETIQPELFGHGSPLFAENVARQSGQRYRRQTEVIPRNGGDNISRHEVDVRSTEGASIFDKRFDELSRQRHINEEEEKQLNAQKIKINQEKERIRKQIKRIDKKNELEQKEDTVKKQRMILEIEKKQLREDIDELDQLKNFLEQRKRDTQSGFNELAETNKDMRSLKSSELHQSASRDFKSRHSMRSKHLRDGDGLPGKKVSNSDSSNPKSSDQRDEQLVVRQNYTAEPKGSRYEKSLENEHIQIYESGSVEESRTLKVQHFSEQYSETVHRTTTDKEAFQIDQEHQYNNQ